MSIPNSPPEAAFDMAISDLELEARNFLDGARIETQAQADALGIIVTNMRQLRKQADTARADEKRPHDDAGKAVQARYKPIIDRADRVISVANAPLTDWLARLEAQRVERERLARIAADEAAQRLADTQSVTGDLEAAEAREQAIADAKGAERHARRIERERPAVAGVGRRVALRTYHETTISNGTAALRWFIAHRPDALRAALLALVNQEPLDTRRAIPGVTVTETKRAA